jgi:FemAB family protein
MSQFEMILNDKAILISIRDPESHKMVGAGFFQYSSSEGLYSVGAYDRSLFDKPLGHAIQQRAIEILKSKGIEWYHIGERHYHQSPHHPSAKEVAISEFKQGFASHIFCRHQFELPTIPNEVDGQ